uniref:Ig-like domain-containing protein n=1 Tax=Paramormyrops kingsleyae TaxID=1676925 RepID=A0A3B3Q718_9TELE
VNNLSGRVHWSPVIYPFYTDNESEVHCSSQNIYPKPHVSWATDPPTSSEALQATTESLPDSVGLFALESWVGILGNRSDYSYICSISLEGASQLWTASLKHQDIIEGVEGQALSIPCHAPNDLQNFTLTWAFMTTGQPTDFLSFSSRTGKVANNWADRVQLDTIQAQSGNGSLQLQNSQGQEMNGTFICTFSNESSRHTVYTSISVTGAGKMGDRSPVAPALSSHSDLGCSKGASLPFCYPTYSLAPFLVTEGNVQSDPEGQKLNIDQVTQNPDSS